MLSAVRNREKRPLHNINDQIHPLMLMFMCPTVCLIVAYCSINYNIPSVIDDSLHKLAALPRRPSKMPLQVPDWPVSATVHPILMYPDAYFLSIQISAVYEKTEHQVNVFNIMIIIMHVA